MMYREAGAARCTGRASINICLHLLASALSRHCASAASHVVGNLLIACGLHSERKPIVGENLPPHLIYLARQLTLFGRGLAPATQANDAAKPGPLPLQIVEAVPCFLDSRTFVARHSRRVFAQPLAVLLKRVLTLDQSVVL